MPVGVDTELFKINNQGTRVKNSILFLGRISPSKNVDIFVEALGFLKKKVVNFTADIYGDALPKDAVYYKKLKTHVLELDLQDIVMFRAGIPNYKTPEIYNQHEFYINLSSSGMYDKTIFEAMACGCLTLASNANLKGQIDERLIIDKREVETVAKYLINTLSLPEEEKNKLVEEEARFAGTHSLQALADRLYQAISPSL